MGAGMVVSGISSSSSSHEIESKREGLDDFVSSVKESSGFVSSKSVASTKSEGSTCAGGSCAGSGLGVAAREDSVLLAYL